MRHIVCAAALLVGMAFGQNPNTQYPLQVKVVQTETIRVPTGAGSTTSCWFYGKGMNCNSMTTENSRWRSVMLVKVSDGNAYIIACDASLFAKCNWLRPGDTYQARWVKHGLSVVAYSLDNKKKRMETTYYVVSSKPLEGN